MDHREFLDRYGRTTSGIYIVQPKFAEQHPNLYKFGLTSSGGRIASYHTAWPEIAGGFRVHAFLKVADSLVKIREKELLNLGNRYNFVRQNQSDPKDEEWFIYTGNNIVEDMKMLISKVRRPVDGYWQVFELGRVAGRGLRVYEHFSTISQDLHDVPRAFTRAAAAQGARRERLLPNGSYQQMRPSRIAFLRVS